MSPDKNNILEQTWELTEMLPSGASFGCFKQEWKENFAEGGSMGV